MNYYKLLKRSIVTGTTNWSLIVTSVLLVSIFNSAYCNDKFKRISTLEGLSQNDVNCIFQDSEGFIWIGTNDGLNRYDGYNFKTYQVTPYQEKGIPSNLVFDIQEDFDGNLWIGTTDEGLFRFNVKNNSFQKLEELISTSNKLSGNRVSSLFIDSKGYIWVGTNAGADVLVPQKDGIYKLVNLTNRSNFDGGIPVQSGVSFFEDDDGTIILLGVQGIYYSLRSDQKSGNFRITTFRGHNPNLNNKIIKYRNKYLLFSQGGIDDININ